MADTKHVTGGCHCGAVRYEADVNLSQAMACNCSLCSKAGWLLTFAPAQSFTLLKGEDNLTDYLFHKRMIHHVFCKTCGVRSFSRGVGPGGQEMVALNVRCLDGVDPDTLAIKRVDGKSF